MSSTVNSETKDSNIPEQAKSAVLVESVPLPKGTPTVQGYEWNRGINYKALLDTYKYSGFQATNFGLAVDEINKMVLAALFFYGKGSYQSCIGQNYSLGMSQCTISRSLHEVTRIINNVLLPEYITFPQTDEAKLKIKHSFMEKFNFPDVIGVVDGTLVTIVPPPVNDDVHPAHLFIDKKGRHSLNTLILSCRSKELPEEMKDSLEDDEFIQRRTNCTIFLGYTSNMVSCGVRETIRFLVEHKLVDCIVTTAGGVEEDLIKCLAPTYIGDFHLEGRKLREKGINRIGNLLVPNENYCLFEDWIMPIFDEMLLEQKEKGTVWTPSKMITRLGEKIDNPSSIYYWAAKNKIPVFSPALTDGSIGDMLYFHSYRNPGFLLDIIQDIRRLNTIAVKASHTGMVIVGGGLIKHHICNANLMRNGADYSVFVNTASEFDGSDSGARPDEAVSWGKIKRDATPVKIYAEATLVFPLLVGETFVRYHQSLKVKAESDV